MAKAITLSAIASFQPAPKATAAIASLRARLLPTEGAWAEAKAKAGLGHGWKNAGCSFGGIEAWEMRSLIVCCGDFL